MAEISGGQRAGGIGCGAIACLFIGWIWISSTLEKCGCTTADRGASARREETERDRKRVEVEAAAAEEGRKNEAILKAKADRERADAKLLKDRLERFWAMDPAGREKALREACAAPDGCDPDLRNAISDAGSSDAERKKLGALAKHLGKSYDAAARAKADAAASAARASADAESDRKNHVIRLREGIGATTEAKLERAAQLVRDKQAFFELLSTDPGVFFLKPGTRVVVVERAGLCGTG